MDHEIPMGGKMARRPVDGPVHGSSTAPGTASGGIPVPPYPASPHTWSVGSKPELRTLSGRRYGRGPRWNWLRRQVEELLSGCPADRHTLFAWRARRGSRCADERAEDVRTARHGGRGDHRGGGRPIAARLAGEGNARRGRPGAADVPGLRDLFRLPRPRSKRRTNACLPIRALRHDPARLAAGALRRVVTHAPWRRSSAGCCDRAARKHAADLKTAALTTRRTKDAR